VVATAQANRAVRSQATTAVAIDGYEELEVRWEPDSQSVAVGTTARLLLVIANRGNVQASYAIAADGDGATVGLPRRALLLAPGSSAQLPVTVDAAQAGAYTVAATVTSAGANAGDSATVTFTGAETTPGTIFLPLLLKEAAQPGRPTGCHRLGLPAADAAGRAHGGGGCDSVYTGWGPTRTNRSTVNHPRLRSVSESEWILLLACCVLRGETLHATRSTQPSL
jgi:hypothetical protein